MRSLLFIMSWALICYSFPANAANYHKTRNYWKCKHRVSGSWEYGRAPSGCDARAFGDDHYIKQYLGPIIYDDNQLKQREQPRYMVEMHLFIRDAALYYLKSRKPNVSSDELDAWQRAIFATAYQESFWSHYRLAKDGRLKIMRGDSGHGHGIMQLDDRWHYVDIKSGKGWNIVGNLVYGMEQFYSYWQKAKSRSCVRRDTDWDTRARSAYAGYNGGFSRMCRWTNRKDKWAHNDQNFYEKFNSRDWELYSLGDNIKSEIDVECMIEGRENCLTYGTEETVEWAGKLLKLPDNQACVLHEEKLECVADIRDVLCLKEITSFEVSDTVQVKQRELKDIVMKQHDRHTLCRQYEPSLLSIGEFVFLNKDINLRESPGGKLFGTVPSGSVFQLLDFELRDENALQRYYRISYEDFEGYIYAGNKHSHAKWLTKSLLPTLPKKWIPVVGDSIKIKRRGGIYLRDKIKGTKLNVIPKDSVVRVAAVKIKGNYNQIYYYTHYGSHNGWIYGGQLLYDSTLHKWAKIVKTIQRENRKGIAANHYWWRYLLDCPGSQCGKTKYRIIGKRMANFCQRIGCNYNLSIVEELAQDMVWVKVKTEEGKIGWIRDMDINWQ